MGINLIESIKGDQIFEYKFPDFLNESNKIGNSADDFEVLQVLGSGAYGNVLKVKSKKNLEIYAMKKVNKNLIRGTENEKYYKNEKLILSKLQSPLVCKCYAIFEENDFMYFVMEFMNNGDLKSFFFGNKYLDLYIPEDILWDLFFKCISGLYYIHKQGIIHRDIKLDNLFLDDNFNIKIGDFNVSAVIEEYAGNFTNEEREKIDIINDNSVVGTEGYKAPEFYENEPEYGQKVDVFSMGVSFYILAYNKTPYIERGNYPSYSKELNDVIYKMIKKIPEDRYSSEEAYSIIKKIYIEKYVKNSAVKSALNCFYSFKNFREFFINKYNKNILQKNKDDNKYLQEIKENMGNSVHKSIQVLGGQDENEKNSILFDLRKNMENYGLNIKYNEEIQIGKFIFYFLKILNSIFNEVVKKENNIIDNELTYLSSQHSFQNGKEEENLNKIIEVYNKRVLSLISKNFMNIIKTKRKCTCEGCGSEKNSFSMLNYIPFNVNILTKNKKESNSNKFHIKDGFQYLLKDKRSYSEQKGMKCENCQKKTAYYEYKSFYHTAKNLIFILNRGENCENKTFIDFDEQLELKNPEVERHLQYQYQLVGIIIEQEQEQGQEQEQEQEHKKKQEKNRNYISFTRNENNLWCDNRNKNEIISFEEIKKKGTVVSLFYYSDNDNLILQSNDSLVQQNQNMSKSAFTINIKGLNNTLINNNFNYNINNTYIAPNNTYIAPNNTYIVPNNTYIAPNNTTNLNNMNNIANTNIRNNMKQPGQNINFAYSPNIMNPNVNQNNFYYNNNYNYNYNYNNPNAYNMQPQNLTGQNNFNINYNNNPQMNNFPGGNFTNINYNNNYGYK